MVYMNCVPRRRLLVELVGELQLRVRTHTRPKPSVRLERLCELREGAGAHARRRALTRLALQSAGLPRAAGELALFTSPWLYLGFPPLASLPSFCATPRAPSALLCSGGPISALPGLDPGYLRGSHASRCLSDFRVVVPRALFRASLLRSAITSDATRCSYILRWRGSRGTPTRRSITSSSEHGGSSSQRTARGRSAVRWGCHPASSGCWRHEQQMRALLPPPLQPPVGMAKESAR